MIKPKRSLASTLFVSVLASMVMSVTVHADNHVWSKQNEDADTIYFIDHNFLKTANNNVTFWQKSQPKHPKLVTTKDGKKAKEWYTLNQIEIDCSNRTYRMAYIYGYYKKHNVDIFSASELNEQPVPVPPQTFIEHIMIENCSQ